MAEESLLRWCWPMTPFDQVGTSTFFGWDMKALKQLVDPSLVAQLGPETDDVRFHRVPKVGENLRLRVSRLSSQGTEIKVVVPVGPSYPPFKVFRYYLPTDGDLALCRELFPNSADPGEPPWLQVEAELLVAGIPSDVLQKEAALTLLNRLKASRKPLDPPSPAPRRNAAERRLAEGSERIRRDNVQIAIAVRAFDRLLKLIEANPVSDPWRGNAGLALKVAQDAGRVAFGHPPIEFVRDDYSEEFRRSQELIPNAAMEWLLQLNFPGGEPTAFRLGWHGELTMPPNSSPGEALHRPFAQLQPDLVGCLKQWLIEFGEWRTMKGSPTEAAAELVSENTPTPEDKSPTGDGQHPDGPEDPYWLWWKGERYPLGSNRKRQAYELLTFFWSRESATFQELVGTGKPWTEAVEDHTFSNAASNFNNDLPLGFPWRLRTGGRRMFKEKISLKS